MRAHARSIFALIMVFTACLTPVAARAAAPLGVATLQVAPTIDGEIGDAEWLGASAADQNFVQIEPAYGEPSPLRTVVRVAQTATALYVAFEAFDPEIERLSAAITQRDAISTREANSPGRVQDDTVAVLLDPFGDGRTAYIFRTNPLSTQEDGRIADNGRAIDLQWDNMWRSVAVRRDDRWTVEFEIPFSILIYAAGMDRTWKANFVRTLPRRLETSVWSGPAESVFRVSGFGDLTGIDLPGQSADVWTLIPYGIASYEVDKGARAEFGGDI
ncbi:MAG: carbohydrate binding family 9 domain-containing protein [Hyphomicrobiaceae bacterium]